MWCENKGKDDWETHFDVINSISIIFLLRLRQTQRRLSLCINEHLMDLSLLRHLRRFWEETKDKGGFDQKTQPIKPELFLLSI